jgi:peptide/nickel transport system ATP-binding protein
MGLTYVFISNDLAVVENLCTTVAVMYFGKIVEQGPRKQIFRAPRHDYTRTLLASVPTIPGRAA